MERNELYIYFEKDERDEYRKFREIVGGNHPFSKNLEIIEMSAARQDEIEENKRMSEEGIAWSYHARIRITDDVKDFVKTPATDELFQNVILQTHLKKMRRIIKQMEKENLA